MDKQLILEFKKLYFGREQIERRVYDKEELEEIWEEINEERQLKSRKVSIKNNEKEIIWYNSTDAIEDNIKYINKNEENELVNYLSKRNRDKIIKIAESLEVASNIQIVNSKISLKILENITLKKCNEKLVKENRVVLNLYSIVSTLKDCEFKFDKDFIKGIYYKLVNEDEKQDISLVDKDSLDEELDELLQGLNEDMSRSPIINAAIIHFVVINKSYFNKYNEVMARLLSYCYLMHSGYKVLRYTSPSQIMLNERKKYYIAIENSSIHHGDITYFIKYYTSVIRYSLESFNKEVAIKHGKKIIKELIDKKNVNLESREIDFINSIISSEKSVVTIYDYKDKEDVSYETARTDLNNLVTLGFFKIGKNGKKYEYYINNISTIIESFEE